MDNGGSRRATTILSYLAETALMLSLLVFFRFPSEIVNIVFRDINRDNPTEEVWFITEPHLASISNSAIVTFTPSGPRATLTPPATVSPTAKPPTKAIILTSTSIPATPVAASDDTLNRIMVGVIVGLLTGITTTLLTYHLTNRRNRSDNLISLKKRLHDSILAEEWDKASEVSDEWWQRGITYREELKVYWNSFTHYDHRTRTIHEAVWKILLDCLEKKRIFSEEEIPERREALKVIYFDIKPQNPKGFLFDIIRNNQFPKKLFPIISFIDNSGAQVWSLLIRHYEKGYLLQKDETHLYLENQNIKDYFQPVRCEYDCEKAIEFLSKERVSEQIVKFLEQKVEESTENYSDLSQNLFIECAKEGGRTSLGIWYVKEVVTSKSRYFPVFISVEDRSDLELIENEIANHLLRDIVVRPDDFSKATENNRKNITALLIYAFASADEVCRSLDELAESSSNSQSINTVKVAIRSQDDGEKWPHEIDKRIRLISKCLLKDYDGYQIILDFLEFGSTEKNWLVQTCQMFQEYPNLKILALLPGKFDGNYSNLRIRLDTLSFSPTELTNILENRLRSHNKNIQAFLADINNSVPRQQFIASAQGRPGLLLKKGCESLRLIDEVKGQSLKIDVSKLFYVPDQLIGLEGEKKVTAGEPAADSSMEEFIRLLNTLDTAKFAEKGDWRTQVELKVRAFYSNKDKTEVSRVLLSFYDVKPGWVRNQALHISLCRQDIIESLPGKNGVNLLKKDKGLFLSVDYGGITSKSDNRKHLFYIDRNFEYIVAVQLFIDDLDDVRKQIEEFYDWN